MAATREDLVRIVRDTIATSECDNPITFDPPEWVIRALARAYERGAADERERDRRRDENRARDGGSLLSEAG